MLKTLRRFCFRLLYNELAFSYDLVSRSVSLGHWRSWQRSALAYLPAPDAGLVLELGHGTGDFQIDLAHAGYTSIALDLSPNMGRLARRKLRRAGLDVNLVLADARGLPLRDNAVVAVVCTFPTSYISANRSLGEIARVLKPSGRAIIVLVGHLRGKGMKRQLIRRLYRLTGQGDELLSDNAIRDLFPAPKFALENCVVTIGDSSAQVVLLKARKEPQPQL